MITAHRRVVQPVRASSTRSLLQRVCAQGVLGRRGGGSAPAGSLGGRGDPAGRQEAGRLGVAEGPDRPRRETRGYGAAGGGRGDRRREPARRKLGDVRYVYTWDGERIFKVVSFYLLRYSRGRLGDLPSETAHEVDETRWLPLEEAPKLLAYGGERQMAAKAVEAVGAL